MKTINVVDILNFFLTIITLRNFDFFSFLVDCQLSPAKLKFINWLVSLWCPHCQNHKKWTSHGQIFCMTSKVFYIQVVPPIWTNWQDKSVQSAIFTVRQRNCGKVIFSVMCLCLFTRGFPCDHYPWCIGPHCTGLLQPGSWSPRTSDMGPSASDIYWPLLQTCSNLITSGPACTPRFG